MGRAEHLTNLSRAWKYVAVGAPLVAGALGWLAMRRGPVRPPQSRRMPTFAPAPAQLVEPLPFDESPWGAPAGSPGYDFHPPHDMGGGRVLPRPLRPHGRPALEIRTSPLTVSGPLAPEAIRRVVLRSLGQVHFCYAQTLATRPTVGGRFVVRFVIDGAGTAIESDVARNSTRAPSLNECLAAAVRRWHFPAAADGHPTSVRVAFDLRPAGDGALESRRASSRRLLLPTSPRPHPIAAPSARRPP